MSNERLLTFVDMKRMTGLSSAKLRYLDRSGKLVPIKKSESGYRYYTQEQALNALKIVGEQVIVAYTLIDNRADHNVCLKNKDEMKVAAIRNNELVERVRELEPDVQVIGIYDIWLGSVEGLNIENVIRMAVNKQVSKVYYNNKTKFVLGDWENYKYWLSLMNTKLIDINDIER